MSSPTFILYKSIITGISPTSGPFPEIIANINEINAGAFHGCSGLTGNITIPKTVTNIGADAFAGCTGLSSVKRYATTKVVAGAFAGVKNVSIIKAQTRELKIGIYNGKLVF